MCLKAIAWPSKLETTEPKSRFNQNLFDGINELIPGNFTFCYIESLALVEVN